MVNNIFRLSILGKTDVSPNILLLIFYISLLSMHERTKASFYLFFLLSISFSFAFNYDKIKMWTNEHVFINKIMETNKIKRKKRCFLHFFRDVVFWGFFSFKIPTETFIGTSSFVWTTEKQLTIQNYLSFVFLNYTLKSTFKVWSCLHLI